MLLDLIEETARHNGHIDLLIENGHIDLLIENGHIDLLIEMADSLTGR